MTYLRADHGDDTPGQDVHVLGSPYLHRTTVIILCLLFLGFNLVDIVLTQTLIQRGYHEANPIWTTIPLWSKLPLALLFIWLFRRKQILVALNVGMATIVAWNAHYLVG